MNNKTSAIRYCAFLRGVNVKGTNMIMSDVCRVFESVGMENVSSVLASGNILFNSNLNKVQLKEKLQQAMSDHFKYEAFLFILDYSEITAQYNNSPFSPQDGFHIYGFTGIKGVESLLLEEFQKSAHTPGEEGQIVGGNFYWRIPKGDTLGSTFGKILGRKNLKDNFTSRNLNTFEKILKKMA